jgi:transcriptional regulator with XRE-family HTH domain
LEQSGTAREQLAGALKNARLSAGFNSHGQFARELRMSRPVVAKAESAGQAVPSDVVLAAWAKATGIAVEEFSNLAARAKSGVPSWFMDYRVAEQEATSLRLWAPLVVPGLLQTPGYARSLLSARRRAPEQLAALVDARMERQQAIGRGDVTAVIDHGVLARCIGSPAVMAEQCGRLAALVESQLISLHVVPEMGNIGLAGAVEVATRGSVATVCLTASSRDITSTAADVVDENMSLFNALLGASLPVVQSLEFVRAQEETWKERS